MTNMISTAGSFGGKTFVPALDEMRLKGQLGRVLGTMIDGEWRTLPEIAETTGDRSPQSVSARLRDLRKARFGAYTVERQRRGEPSEGLYEYRVLPPQANGAAILDTSNLLN